MRGAKDPTKAFRRSGRAGRRAGCLCTQRVIDRIRRNTAAITWALAWFIGMAACGALGVLLLRAIGFAGVRRRSTS
ncbi:MAG: hypothetical protein H0V79_13330 [Actinobacteria bacterium]|nr:hypothetical protein [Actinomycetota bacterium]